MTTKLTLTPELLREALTYDRDTGVFRWRTPRTPWVKPGAVAGFRTSTGYWALRLFGGNYLAHRVAWLYVYDRWPTGGLDHRNENTLDNRIANLREATDAENVQNQSAPRRNNTSGYRGVSAEGTRWRATISHKGHQRRLGTFDTPEEASAAYLTAKAVLHPFWVGT
jgi:hypothetical protein